MKRIRNEPQQTRASRLWFSIVTAFVAIFSITSVAAESLTNGLEFKEIYGKTIRIFSSNEVEIDEKGSILLGKFTIDGERIRIVTSAFGSTNVMYYKITPDGLVAEEGGQIFYSKAGVAGQQVEILEKIRFIEEERNRQQRMTDNKDGTITHISTKLMWQKDDDGNEKNWGDSINYCRGLSLAAHSDWRLPNNDELNDLWKMASSDAAIRNIYFPGMKSSLYWSSTELGLNPVYAHTVPEPDPGVNSLKSRAHYVRCVRSSALDANSTPQQTSDTKIVAASNQLPNMGSVIEVVSAGVYTYMRVSQHNKTSWIAVSKIEVKTGDIVRFPEGPHIFNFYSKNSNRTFDEIMFVEKVAVQ